MPVSTEQWRVSVGLANASRSLRSHVTSQSKRKLTPWDILVLFFTALLGAILFPSMMPVSSKKWHAGIGLASQPLWSHGTNQPVGRWTSWDVAFPTLLDGMLLSGGDRRGKRQRSIPKGRGTVGDMSPFLLTAVRRKQLLIVAGDVETNPGPVDLPKINQHPKDQSVATGGDMEFSIKATGDNLLFQWKKNGHDLSDNDKYHGTKTHTLWIVAVEESDKAHYSCLVKNDVGEVLSDPAILRIITHLEPTDIGFPQPAAIPPLLITFKSGYCPKGLFGSLIACIARNTTLDLDKSNIHRDQICFALNQCNLLLRVSPTSIYLEINPGNTVKPLSVLCNGFREMILNSIDEACKTLHYSLTAHTDYFLSFEGWCDQCKKLHPLQTVLNVDHLKVDLFQCNQSQNVVKPSLRWYIWLPEPTIQSNPEKKRIVAPGTDVKFKIEATGDDLKFQWQKNRKTDLSDDEKYCDTGTDTLHIVEVEKGDKGRYRCCVSNYTGETFSEEAFLTVINPPKFIQHPYSMSVATGIDITLKVIATGDCLHFRWQKDCIDLCDDNRYRDTDTDTFHISKVEKSDNKASYRCHIKNDLDEKFSKEAVLTVIDPPKITHQHPENKSVPTGASTTLTFEASGDDLQFQWKKDGKDLHDGSKYHGTKTDTLHIKDVKKSDKGNYQYLVKNDVGELSGEANLAISEVDQKEQTEHIQPQDVDHYLSICEKLIQEEGKMDQTIMHCIFLGAAGVGKSCLMKRLLGETVVITDRTSTQIAEKSVRVVSRTVAEISDSKWEKIDDTNKYACGLMEQMSTRSKEAKQQADHEQVNNSEEQNTNEQLSNQRGGSTPASGKEQKDACSAAKDANKRVPVSKQQESVPDNSQAPKSTDDSQAPKSTDGQAPNSTDDSQASKSTERGSSKRQQLPSIGFLRNILENEGVSGVKKYVSNPKTIYLTDSGGQPEFQELLPALVVGPCIFIVVLRLDKDLKEKYQVDYVRPGNQKHMPNYSASLTMQEDLMRSLASIASTKCKNEEKVKSRVMLVATFIDKVPPKVCKARLAAIEALIEETDSYKQGMIVCTLDKSNVFTINNASAVEAEEDATKIRAAFKMIAKDFKLSTPWSWLIFSILVQHNEYENAASVICYGTCFKLAQDCGIEKEKDFEAALQFLHRQTGILHYYKEPSELSQIVVRNPQYLFSRVNHLVEKTFNTQNANRKKTIEDFEKGLFKREDYDRLTKTSSNSKLTPSMLLKLLEHINAVVPLDRDGESYFMPCAITHLQPSASGVSQSDAIPPLLITFKSGYCPKGLFGSLVSCIANKRVSNSTLDLDQSEIYRDQICFNMGEGRLLLRVNPTFIYIEIIPCNSHESLSTLSKLCNGVRKLIFENISEACKALHYLLKEDTDYFLSFKGRCNQCNKDHPVVLQPVQNDKHLKVHSFQCKQSLWKVDPSLKCYIWLPEPTIQSHLTGQLVASGREAVFKVEATGDDVLHFQWQKECVDISDESGDGYRGTKSQTLQILNVEKKHDGRYRCHVMNYVEGKHSNEALLTVTTGCNWKKTSVATVCVLLLIGAVLGPVIGMWWWLDCGTLTHPANGHVSHTGGTTLGQTATYSCNPGYNLVGDSSRKCQATGVWSGSAPTCQLLHHTKPPGYNSGGCHSITNLQELDKAVAEIGLWKALCENLGVHKAVLSNLCDMINTDNTVKKRRCLEAYINTGKACWEKIVKVVADHPFYNARLAEEIANMHVVGSCKDEF